MFAFDREMGFNATPLRLAPGGGVASAWRMKSRIWAAVGVACLGIVGSAETPSVRQGAALLKTDLLGVFAHPDDETGVAGTLAHYALGQGKVVANVYCTRGEGGGNMVGTQSGPALGVLREAELRDCLNRLGVRYAYFLDREDFAYTESLSVTLEKWDHEDTLRRLVRLVRSLRPEVIVTMNPAPNPGQHGNHQAAGLLAIEAFTAAGDPQWFPEQLAKEGLSVWQPRKLYYGGPGGTGATLDLSKPLPGGGTAGEIAGQALANHRSQAFGNFANSPWLRRPQSFTLVESVVPFATDETDLFRGLPVTGEVRRGFAPGDEPLAEGFQLRFVPRPAVDHYQQWVARQRIGHVAAQYVTDLPVTAGAINDVFLYTANPTAEGVNATVRFTAPPGWKLNFEEVNMRFSAQRTNRMRVIVTPPEGRPADGEITAVTTVQGRELRTTARLHPVPLVQVPVASGLNLAAGDFGNWAALPAHAIAPALTWQGTVANAADCSGEFRVAHDRTNVFVEVRVRDDRVVSNIEPNDIKGHWRSDSVELCFDPRTGAEHTLGCYKVGIFPFDTAGTVRAARDADANPGEIAESAPGTRLVSWKTEDGYAIRAMIPFAEIGLRPTKDEREFGFNVLIYDGDKPDAAKGENINRSRLAWSPRPGVQGRPEDWGRARLE